MCGRDGDAEGVKVTIGKPPCRVCIREPPETNTSMRVRNRRMECRLDSGKGIPSPFCQRRCILPYRSHRRQRRPGNGEQVRERHQASPPPRYRLRTAASVASSSGLAMCSFMPTVLAACTSSVKALAVMATIGTRLQ